MAVMLPAHSTDCLMLHTEELAIYMAGHNMCGTMASPAVAAGGEMAGDTVNIVAGGACARTRRQNGCRSMVQTSVCFPQVARPHERQLVRPFGQANWLQTLQG